MKKTIIGSVIVLVNILIPQMSQAQGTVYVSNLGQTSVGNVSAGSNAWFAADFITGTNVDGYTLNSIELGMTDATGNPNGFMAMIYSANGGAGVTPGNNLETLNGSANPSTAGIYTYNDVSNLTLLPSTYYFIVLTAGTAISSGAYGWSVTDTPSFGYNSYHWGGEVFFLQSNNGSSWNSTSSTYGQFALNATPVPEPSSLVLLGLSGLFFIRHRCKAKAL
jgi:hypothetical protein